jgi:hypothetical protein
MTLQRRERILVYVAGGLLGVLAGWFLLFGGESRSTKELEADLANLNQDVIVKRALAAEGDRDERWMRDWRKRALPADKITARTLYQTWLRGLADRCHFHPLAVESKEMETRGDMFTRLQFTVRGHVSLADLTQFLYDFYSAGHLQQIRQMTMKSLAHGSELDVTVTIEALSLPNADRKDQLGKETGKGLQLAKVEDYRVPIVKRNLFSRYTPPSATVVADKNRDKPKEKGLVDTAQFTFVTGFTEIDGLRQVWIQDRTGGKVWQLKEGGVFKVGERGGTVREITPTREVTIDFDGHRRRLRDGDNLCGGAEVKGYGKN